MKIDNKKTFIKKYKERCYPTPEQEELFKRTFGCRRFLYNQLLADLIKEHTVWVAAGKPVETRPKMSKYDLAARLPALKKEYPFLAEVSSGALALVTHQLSGAFTTFFKSKGKKGYPKFKNRYSRKSFSLDTNKFYFKDEERTVLKIVKSKDPLKIKFSRPLPDRPTELSISKDPSGEHYVSFTCK